MPRWGTFVVSLDELGYPAATLREVAQSAAKINRDAGLIVLGMFNLVASPRWWTPGS